MTPRRHPTVPEFWGELKEHIRKITDAVNGLLSGRTNNWYDVTLTQNATETILISPLVGLQTRAYLSPRTESAALARVWSTAADGILTIHHDAAPDPDRQFTVLLVG